MKNAPKRSWPLEVGRLRKVQAGRQKTDAGGQRTERLAGTLAPPFQTAATQRGPAMTITVVRLPAFARYCQPTPSPPILDILFILSKSAGACGKMYAKWQNRTGPDDFVERTVL